MSRFRDGVVRLWEESKPQQIAETLGCSVATVYNIAKSEGLPRRKRRANHKWSPEQDAILRTRFSQDTPEQLMQQLSPLNYDQIRSRAKRLGLSSKRTTHLNAVQHDFFAQVDTHNSYWAGFIAADGCIHEEQEIFSIFLAARDREHLDRLSMAVCGSRRARLAKGRMGPNSRA